MQQHIIVYKYKGKQYTTVTKPCTQEQATQAFYDELNSLKCFKLVRVVPK